MIKHLSKPHTSIWCLVMKPHFYFANLVVTNGDKSTLRFWLKGIAIHDSLLSSFDWVYISLLNPKVVFWNHPLVKLVRQNIVADVPFTQHLSHNHNLHFASIHTFIIYKSQLFALNKVKIVKSARFYILKTSSIGLFYRITCNSLIINVCHKRWMYKPKGVLFSSQNKNHTFCF